MEFFSEHFEELLFDVICHFVTFTCSKKKRLLRIACLGVINKSTDMDLIYTQRVITDRLWKYGTQTRTFLCLHQYLAKSTAQGALCNYFFVKKRKVNILHCRLLLIISPNTIIFATVSLSYELLIFQQNLPLILKSN